MKVTNNASLAVGIHGMFVDALDEEARAFYAGRGFIQLVIVAPAAPAKRTFTDAK
ncbi:hypothetical protein SNN83_004430 [Cronobacter malonaticus]|nr:hypothetical protein [Cronobacter malonaticus]